MRGIGTFVRKELLEMVPPTAFFILVFQVVVLTRSAIGGAEGVSMTTTASALVGALIVGKAVLIADSTPLFHWFRERALILNVAWRTLLYLCVTLVLQLLEEYLPLVSRYGGMGAALEHLGEEIDWKVFWVTHLAFALFLAFYSFATALIEVVGGDRFRRIFFGLDEVRP